MNMVKFRKINRVPVLNVIEDMDGDGVENHWDLDDDGDGFSDEVEIAYGSDPLDPNSWPMLILSLFLISTFLFLETILPVVWLEP